MCGCRVGFGIKVSLEEAQGQDLGQGVFYPRIEGGHPLHLNSHHGSALAKGDRLEEHCGLDSPQRSQDLSPCLAKGNGGVVTLDEPVLGGRVLGQQQLLGLGGELHPGVLNKLANVVLRLRVLPSEIQNHRADQALLLLDAQLPIPIALEGKEKGDICLSNGPSR